MKDKDFENWQETRKDGMIHFILLGGLLSYGLPMFIVMAWVTKPFANGYTSTSAIIHYIVWPIAGILFGAIMWFITEQRYLSEVERRKGR